MITSKREHKTFVRRESLLVSHGIAVALSLATHTPRYSFVPGTVHDSGLCTWSPQSVGFPSELLFNRCLCLSVSLLSLSCNSGELSAARMTPRPPQRRPLNLHRPWIGDIPDLARRKHALTGLARADAVLRRRLDRVRIVAACPHLGRRAHATLSLTIEVALARGPARGSGWRRPIGAVRAERDLRAKGVVRARPGVAGVGRWLPGVARGRPVGIILQTVAVSGGESGGGTSAMLRGYAAHAGRAQRGGASLGTQLALHGRQAWPHRAPRWAQVDAMTRFGLGRLQCGARAARAPSRPAQTSSPRRVRVPLLSSSSCYS